MSGRELYCGQATRAVADYHRGGNPQMFQKTQGLAGDVVEVYGSTLPAECRSKRNYAAAIRQGGHLIPEALFKTQHAGYEEQWHTRSSIRVLQFEVIGTKDGQN